MRTHLVTGFPGFIGRRLVAALLERDPAVPIVALVEARMLEPAREAAAAIDVAPGSRSSPATSPSAASGLADDELRAPRRRGRDVVHHLAAIYDLAVPAEIAQRVNVEGTGNVLDFCRDAERLERLNYVSTAYVAGDRTGVAYEHELDLGQGFKNHYESTKFQAEVWVREPDRRGSRRRSTGRRSSSATRGRARRRSSTAPTTPLRFIAASRRAQDAGRQHRPRRDAVQRGAGRLHRRRDGRSWRGREAAIGETVHLCDPDPLSSARDVQPADRALRRPQARLPGAARGCRGGPSARPVRESLRRHAVGVDPLPQPPGPLRHPPSDRAACGESACAARASPSTRRAMVGFFREHEDDPALAPAQTR